MTSRLFFSVLGILILGMGACSKLQEDVVPPLPQKVTYRDHIQPLLERSCVRCHNGTLQNGNVNLATYETVVALPRIEAGNPECTFLTRIINPGGKMHQYLDDPRDFDLFYQWIVVDSLAEFP